MQNVCACWDVAVLTAPGTVRERNRAYLQELSDLMGVEQQTLRALNVAEPHWKLCADRISFFGLELPKVR